mmetsp:Transcript_19247/g.41591  ORF Transcript_19247/g.41591 Transcript_19247/m.41591 type:complete len:159 (+) Transcript_19247:3212-3688(+)
MHPCMAGKSTQQVYARGPHACHGTAINPHAPVCMLPSARLEISSVRRGLSPPAPPSCVLAAWLPNCLADHKTSPMSATSWMHKLCISSTRAQWEPAPGPAHTPNSAPPQPSGQLSQQSISAASCSPKPTMCLPGARHRPAVVACCPTLAQVQRNACST